MAQNKKSSSQNKSGKSSAPKGKSGSKPKASAVAKKPTAKKAAAKKPAVKKPATKKTPSASKAKTVATTPGVDIDIWTSFGMDERPLSKAVDPVIAKAEATADSVLAAAASAKGGFFARLRAWLRSA